MRRLARLHGLPRGVLLTWPLGFVRFAVAFGVFFGSYDAVKRAVAADRRAEHHPAATFALRALSGGISGVLTWCAPYRHVAAPRGATLWWRERWFG